MVERGVVVKGMSSAKCSMCSKDLGTYEELDQSGWGFCPYCGEPLLYDDDAWSK